MSKIVHVANKQANQLQKEIGELVLKYSRDGLESQYVLAALAQLSGYAALLTHREGISEANCQSIVEENFQLGLSGLGMERKPDGETAH